MPRITIEDKHIYNTLPQRALYTDFARQGSTVNVTPNIVVNKLKYPSEGTTEDGRVGRKIHTTSVVSEGYIYYDNTLGFSTTLSGATVSFGRMFYGTEDSSTSPGEPGYIGRKKIQLDDELNTLQEKWNISIRHFIIEFDDNSFYSSDSYDAQTYIQDWFKNLVIQTNTDRYPSNTTQILRESTPYTGTFRILYDKTHHLTPSNTVLHYSYTLPYKRTLNFDASGAEVPTNKTLIEIFIPASDYKVDFGNLDFGNYAYDYTAGNVGLGSFNYITVCSGYINSTLKLKYTDI